MTTEKTALRPGNKRSAAADRHAVFAAEYLVDRNATQAAIRAGYSPHTAKQQGSRLLTNADVRGWIEAENAKTMAKLGVSRARVVSEFAAIAFANLLDYGQVDEEGNFELDLSNTTHDQMAAVQEITGISRSTIAGDDTEQAERPICIKLADKRKALVSLGQYLGLFKNGQPSATTVSFNIIGLNANSPTVMRG
jgi:phage terminase small subunit